MDWDLYLRGFEEIGLNPRIIGRSLADILKYENECYYIIKYNTWIVPEYPTRDITTPFVFVQVYKNEENKITKIRIVFHPKTNLDQVTEWIEDAIVYKTERNNYIITRNINVIKFLDFHGRNWWFQEITGDNCHFDIGE